MIPDPDKMSSEDLTSLSHLEKDFIPKLNKNFTNVRLWMGSLDTRITNAEYDIHDLTNSMETWTDVLNRFSLFDEDGSFDKIMQFEERLEKLEEKIEGLEKKYQEHFETLEKAVLNGSEEGRS
jgi:archaellum component FlaC